MEEPNFKNSNVSTIYKTFLVLGIVNILFRVFFDNYFNYEIWNIRYWDEPEVGWTFGLVYIVITEIIYYSSLCIYFGIFKKKVIIIALLVNLITSLWFNIELNTNEATPEIVLYTDNIYFLNIFVTLLVCITFIIFSIKEQSRMLLLFAILNFVVVISIEMAYHFEKFNLTEYFYYLYYTLPLIFAFLFYQQIRAETRNPYPHAPSDRSEEVID